MNKPKLIEPNMQRGTKTVSLAELYPIIEEVLASGGTFSLTVTGTSMYPFILGARDQVTLSPPPSRLKRYDLPLYRRRSGQFVLHRVVRVEKDGTYTMCGDHQTALEKGIRQEQIIAIATAYTRKGTHLTNRNLIYRCYRVLWTRLLGLRPVFFRLRDLCAAVKYHFRKT